MRRLGRLQKQILQVLIDGGHIALLQGAERVNVEGWETELDGSQRFYLCPRGGSSTRIKKDVVLGLVLRGLLSVTTEDLQYARLPKSDARFTRIDLK